MDEIIVYSLSYSQGLAKRLCEDNHWQLGEVFQEEFADGEVLAKPLSDAKNKHAIIVQSIYKPACENLFKILLLIDSIKRMGARKITLVIPYFGFSRQERVADINEPISCKVVADIFNHSGVDQVLTLDLHNAIINSFFNIPFKPIKTSPIFKDYYLDLIKKRNIELSSIMIVAPDHGANERALELAKELGVKNNVVILKKYRPQPNECEVLEIGGNVDGKFCIIIDDIIDTGKTIAKGSEILYKHGAIDVVVGATHGVFSCNAVERLINAKISDICVCNTIEKDFPSQVKVLDVKDLISFNL